MFIDPSLVACGNGWDMPGLGMLGLATGWEMVGTEIPLIGSVSEHDSEQSTIGLLMGLPWVKVLQGGHFFTVGQSGVPIIQKLAHFGPTILWYIRSTMGSLI